MLKLFNNLITALLQYFGYVKLQPNHVELSLSDVDAIDDALEKYVKDDLNTDRPYDSILHYQGDDPCLNACKEISFKVNSARLGFVD